MVGHLPAWRRSYGFVEASGGTIEGLLRYLIEAIGHPDAHVATYSQVRWLRPALDRGAVDRILRLEQLDEDWGSLPIHTAGAADLPLLNPTKFERHPWQHYVTPEVAALVETWASEDFDVLGYPRLAERGEWAMTVTPSTR